MPPKKKAKLLKKVPEDVKWCLDRSNRLSFREFIENEYFKSKSTTDTKIRDDYKNWTSSADYIRFWSTRSKSNTLLKTELGCSEIIDIMTEQQLRSLQIIAASNGASGGDSSAPDISSDSPAPNEPTSPTNTMLLEVRDYLISDMTNFVNEEDTNDNPWMFKDINISDLFRKYQAATSEILVKHKALPVESYVHELASLTHILFLCKDQHSEIAEKVFSLKTLQQPMAFFERKLGKQNKRTSNYGVYSSGFSDELWPKTSSICQSELWSTYFDPLLSCLISDPDRLIHLRWTNAIPMEKGKNRPDAVISEKQQMSFGNSVGYGEAKTQQGSCSKSLCLDTLRLAIFTKNAIDINKLDGALAFQIHAFNITFYLQQLTAKGIYTFIEIAHFRFPQSLDDLPSLFTMINIKNSLGLVTFSGAFVENPSSPI
ncbi:hypothetical protein G6F70_002080 [Rhizopus microsporus]|uniref:Uncharacterized protein n=1 Tax=Rhizopus azygosporus TaxID=86630 RepID=A0A367IVP7_RHIAZ|nr:hypothetical protein G6F71_009152 [Rhizopus microsporus]RCH81754.1 hypothetical protein CU097_002502 [Rhizopus azygosporus]KAG1202645.1 hypothetical protein G6F70_002080 [Rhizopus microsporus]KAG1209177.1 hypothetical protein G6F69_006572 [Rhizopus microsporus]KAG1233005.1 hypothetical protein G6F67_004582 [Rhizopus microsporus]